ncbi:MAG TPA: hypothetical protein PL033_17875 [Candidatus Brocadiia bacterium]|nr:hypothetical protein [Candidatus Brocadiia bacterium]
MGEHPVSVETPTPYRFHPDAVIAGLLVLLTWLAFGRSVGYDFVNWDDPDFVTRNPLVLQPGAGPFAEAFVRAQAGYYAPFLWWSYRIVAQTVGIQPWAFHALNVLFHSANAALAFLLFRRFGASRFAAGWGAALWAVHPMRVESVAWVTELKDVQSGFFCLASGLVLFPAARGGGDWAAGDGRLSASRNRMLAAMFLFALALGTKGTTCVWPLGLAAAAAFGVEGVTRRPLESVRYARHARLKEFAGALKRLWPLIVMGGLFALLMFAAQYRGGAVQRHLLNDPMRVLAGCYSFSFHLYKMWVPGAFSPTWRLPQPGEQSSGSQYWWAVLAVVLAVRIAWRREPRYTPVSFALAWYALLMLPMLQLIPTARPLGERYTYLPGIAVCAAVVSLFEPSAASKHANSWLYWRAPLLVVVYAAIAFQYRLPAWRSSEALWTSALEANPDDSLALNNLALVIEKQGRADEAMALWRRAIEGDPTAWKARGNLAYRLCRRGQIGDLVEARRLLDEADRAKPGDISLAITRAALLLYEGNFAEAERLADATLARRELDPGLIAALGSEFLDHAGKAPPGPRARLVACAVRCLERAVFLAPTEAAFRSLLARAREEKAR